MHINPSLLRKYAAGQCTPQETWEVENWLASMEDDAVLSPEEVGNSPQIIRERLYGSLFGSGNNTVTIPLYKKLIRFATAACIICATFLGGRFSVNTANATIPVDTHPKDHLYISGGNNAQGNLPGDNFKVSFKGTLRFYNGSMIHKSIQVGDSSFTLEPRNYYYLQGSVSRPYLIKESSQNFDFGDTFKPKGYFSILRLDEK